jgi:hypothetical protein
MSNTRALLLLPLAAGMLALAALEESIIKLMGSMGVDSDAVALVGPWLSAVLAGVGFVLLLVSLVAYMGNLSREQQWRPYMLQLKPLAAEFGRGVKESKRGIEFEIQRDGQRVELLVDPRSGGGILVRSPPPARQSLAWFRASAPPPSPSQGWREVERNIRWQLRAELPAMARPLLADTTLIGPVERFFEASRGVSVTHAVTGIVIEGELVPDDAIGDQARLCIEIAFRLRRLNG